jgi:hypothetical protein
MAGLAAHNSLNATGYVDVSTPCQEHNLARKQALRPLSDNDCRVILRRKRRPESLASRSDGFFGASERGPSPLPISDAMSAICSECDLEIADCPFVPHAGKRLSHDRNIPSLIFAEVFGSERYDHPAFYSRRQEMGLIHRSLPFLDPMASEHGSTGLSVAEPAWIACLSLLRLHQCRLLRARLRPNNSR